MKNRIKSEKRRKEIFLVLALVVVILGMVFLDKMITGASVSIGLPVELSLNQTNSSLELEGVGEEAVLNETGGSLGLSDIKIQAGTCGGNITCNCSNTVNESYNLSGDLGPCLGNGLEIGADNIIVDCKGWSISNLYNNGGGIYNNDYDNITIKNCNITGFDKGVYFYRGADNGFIYNNTFSGNVYGVELVHKSNHNLIENNTVRTTKDNQYGVLLDDYSDFNVLKNNTVETSGDSAYGIYLSNSGYNSLINNTITIKGKSSAGIYVYQRGANNLTGNIINTTNTESKGIWVYYAEQGILKKNWVKTSGDAGEGIKLHNSNLINLTNNTVITEGYDSYGIYLYSSKANLFDNQINTSKANSLAVFGNYNQTTEGNLAEGLPIVYNYSVSNKVIYENVDLTNVYGQLICADCVNVTYNNVTIGNDGINLFGTLGKNSTIKNSKINTTKGYGIWVFVSDDSKILNNKINSSIRGIFLDYVEGGNLTNNVIVTNASNSQGIKIGLTDPSEYVKIVDNIIHVKGNNSEALSAYTNYGEYVNNTITVDTVENSTGFSLKGEENNLSGSYILNKGYGESYGLELVNAYNNILRGLNITTDKAPAIYLWSNSRENILRNVEIGSNNLIRIEDETGNSYMNYLIYNNSYGEIRWTDTANNSFLKNLTLDGNIGLGINLFIGDNVAALNTSAFNNSKINSSVNITLKQLNFTTITEIFKWSNYTTNNSEVSLYGTDCLGSNCTLLSWGVNTLVFNTSSLSSFTVNGTNASANTAPNTTLVLVNASTTNNGTNDDIYCWAKGEDAEQTLLKAYWIWYKNGAEFSSGSKLISNNTLTYLSTISPLNTSFGENWTCSVKMYDGFDNESDWNNASITIKGASCNDSLTGSLNLTSDLNCTDDGLIIKANNIVLNCANHWVEGDGGEYDYGVYNKGYTNITIKNCRINNFGRGIYFAAGSINSLIKNDIISNTSRWGMDLISSDNTRIINNTITGNKGYVGSSSGIYLSGDNYTIINNTLKDNLFRGIEFGFSDDNYMQGNELINNSVGYELWGGKNNQFMSERIINHSGSGFLLQSISYNNTFKNSFFEGNQLDLNLSGAQSNVTLINSSFNKSKLLVEGLSKAYFKWYVEVNVTDGANNALENVNVTAYDSEGTLADIRLTDSQGMAQLTLTEFYRENEVNYYFVPHNIKAVKNNYTENSTSVNLYNKTGANVSLSLTKINCGVTVYANVYLGENLTCNGTGIIIGKDNLVINGGEYNLIGNGSETGIDLNGKSNVSVVDLGVLNFTRGINFLNADNSNLTKIIVANNSYGVVFNNSNNNVIYDSTLANNSAFSVWATNVGGTNNSMVNVSIDINDINVSGTANVFLKWYVDVNATYQSGALPNANVYGYFNSSGLLEDSAITNSEGEARLVLSELKKNSSGITYLTPHNITLSYSLSRTNITNSTIINLSQTNNTKVNLSIALNCTSPYSYMNIINNTLFCPGTFEVKDLTVGENVSVACASTIFKGKNDVGIRIWYKNNVTLNDCSFEGYSLALYLISAHNFVINNTKISDCQGYYGVEFLDSSEGLMSNFELLGEKARVYLYNSSNITISQGKLKDVAEGLILYKSNSNKLINNTFIDNNKGIRLTYSNNTFVYHNNFSSTIDYNIYSSSAGYTNYFNTSINVSGNMSGQGNEWSDYCEKGVDLNGDGYADNVSSAGAGDWPYSENITDKIYDPTPGNAGVIDWGPRIIACPEEEVFLGGGGGGAPPAEEEAGEEEAEVPKPSKKKEEVVEEEVYNATEAAKNLRRETTTEKVEKITKVKVILENTGTKKMLLFPELLQQLEEPFFIVTKKTLGFEGSLFSRLAGIAYSKDRIAGRLLKAEILNPEQIILEPGERIEKVLEVEEGLVAPREIKIQFTTLGETVFEEEIAVEREALSGTAIDLDKEKNVLDVYAVIVPGQISELLREYYAEQLITGMAVADFPTDSDVYMLELNINKKEEGEVEEKLLPIKFSLAKKVVDLILKPKTSFGDLYGPYKMAGEQSFIFAQQFKYNPEVYSGEYIVQTKIYREEEVVVENEFEVELR